MPQKSSIILQLSDEDRTALDKLMVSGKWTVLGLVEWLGQRGYEISKSAVHRYMQDREKVAARIRQSREMAAALAAEVGEDIVSSKQGHLVVEILRTMVFDFMTKQMEEDATVDPQAFFFLGKAIKDLASANRLDQDYAAKVREQIAKEERAKAADAGAKALAGKGLTKKEIEFWRRDFLGVPAAAAKGGDA